MEPHLNSFVKFLKVLKDRFYKFAREIERLHLTQSVETL